MSDPHPVLAEGNSPKGVSDHEAIFRCEADLDRSTDEATNAHSASRLGVPSVPLPFFDNFGDKRRRLLSTPLLTGYYVTDRPPDGLSHNNR